MDLLQNLDSPFSTFLAAVDFFTLFYSLPPREAHCYSMTDDEDHGDDDKADDCVASWVDQPVGRNGPNGSELLKARFANIKTTGFEKELQPDYHSIRLRVDFTSFILGR